MSSGDGLVGLRVLLGGEEDVLVAGHRRVERVDAPLAPDEELTDHVREHDDVPERKERDDPPFAARSSAAALTFALLKNIVAVCSACLTRESHASRPFW